jgi:hypothetical protein
MVVQLIIVMHQLEFAIIKILTVTPSSQMELVLWIPIMSQVMSLDLQFTMETIKLFTLLLILTEILLLEMQIELVINLLVMQDNKVLTFVFQQEITAPLATDQLQLVLKDLVQTLFASQLDKWAVGQAQVFNHLVESLFIQTVMMEMFVLLILVIQHGLTVVL